jgi:hypothetical protein
MEHKKGSLNDLNSFLLTKVHGHCLIHKLQLQEFHCLNFYSAGDFVNMTVEFTEINYTLISLNYTPLTHKFCITKFFIILGFRRSAKHCFGNTDLNN